MRLNKEAKKRFIEICQSGLIMDLGLIFMKDPWLPV